MSRVALDTSLLVPALAPWHEARAEALTLVRREVDVVPGHVLVETMSVLTRLPAPHRIAPGVVAAALAALPVRTIGLSADRYAPLLAAMARVNVSGGALYDALVAASALEHGATLLTRDVRAARTYEAVGVDFRIV